MTTISIDGTTLDRMVSDLREHAASWTAVPLAERIALLERMLPKVTAGAADMAAAGSRAKGLAAGSAWAAEDWFSGPWALAQNIQAHLHVLRRIDAGHDPVQARVVHERDGRAYVDVLPATGWDTLLLNGFTAQVWLRPGTTAEQARARAGRRYRHRAGHPGVAAVLGAGNVAAITPLDTRSTPTCARTSSGSSPNSSSAAGSGSPTEAQPKAPTWPPTRAWTPST